MNIRSALATEGHPPTRGARTVLGLEGAVERAGSCRPGGESQVQGGGAGAPGDTGELMRECREVGGSDKHI